VKWLRRLLCRHNFRICDMGHRDEKGWLLWPCCKCDYVARVEYGLQVGDFGTITGPVHPERTKP
jgi:hypothetical protein